MRSHSDLKNKLDAAVSLYNNVSFIEADPICIPHRYSKLQDIEIAGFITAMFSWGQRKTIINKSSELMSLMGRSPHEFVLNHTDSDLKKMLQFKHRTFQTTDLLYFLSFFQRYYRRNNSLENAFLYGSEEWNAYEGLSHYHTLFFDHELAPRRTKKHVSTPVRGSSCKRLNMFLRWMVRKDKNGVDFGLWTQLKPADLKIPLDVHVYRVARKLKLLQRDKTDWKAVEELTDHLKLYDPDDPVKYDYALFGMGVLEII